MLNPTEVRLIRATIDAQGYPQGPIIHKDDAKRMRIANRLCLQLGFTLHDHPGIGGLVYLYHPTKQHPTPTKEKP